MRKTLVVVADDHAGSPVALPPNGDAWDFVDGGPRPFCDWQVTLWGHWVECWQHVADLRKGGQLIVVHAGDATEGKHHDTVELLTSRIDEQERMHISAMQEGLRLAKWKRRTDKLIYLTGTEAHTGNGNSSTERIARALLQTEELDGSVILPWLYKAVNGCVFDIAHKGFKLGSREWTRTNTMRAYLTSRHISCLKARKPMPRYVIRAHQHTFGYARLEDDDSTTISEAYLMPSFKLKDGFIYSLAPEAVCNIGLLVFVVESNGDSRPYPQLMKCEQDPVEEL